MPCRKSCPVTSPKWRVTDQFSPQWHRAVISFLSQPLATPVQAVLEFDHGWFVSMNHVVLFFWIYFIDYFVFASSDFDPNEYANAILAADSAYLASESKHSGKGSSLLKGPLQDSIAKEDISMAISKLSFGIEDVSKQIRSLVRLHTSFAKLNVNPYLLLRLQLTTKIC